MNTSTGPPTTARPGRRSRWRSVDRAACRGRLRRPPVRSRRYTLIEMMIAMIAAVGRASPPRSASVVVMQNQARDHDRPLHRRGRSADDRRPHHQGPARRGHHRRHRRRVRVGRRERRDVLREPRRPEQRPDEAARVPHAAAGTNVYLFHEDATAPDAGGSRRQLHVHRRRRRPASTASTSTRRSRSSRTTTPTDNPIPTPITTTVGSAQHRRRRASTCGCACTPTSPIVVIQTRSPRPQHRLQPERREPMIEFCVATSSTPQPTARVDEAGIAMIIVIIVVMLLTLIPLAIFTQADPAAAARPPRPGPRGGAGTRPRPASTTT